LLLGACNKNKKLGPPGMASQFTRPCFPGVVLKPYVLNPLRLNLLFRFSNNAFVI